MRPFYAVLLIKQLCLLKKNFFLYVCLMDGGSGHLPLIVATGGGAFANEIFLLGQAFDQFFRMPGCCPGVLAAGID